MRVDPISRPGLSGLTHSTTRPSANSPSFADVQKARSQSVTIDVDTPIDLGLINGKPIILTLHETGLEWNGSPRIPGPTTPGSRVTPEQLAAVEAFDRYSPEEHAEVQKSLGIVRQLWLLTRHGATMASFREYTDQMSLSRADLATALQRLNLDPNSPFTINGRNFALGPQGLEER